MKTKRMVNAYMTVEASFIIIWVLFLMVFLMYTSFYMYDKCVMFQDSYAIAFRSSIQPVKTDGIRAYINSRIEGQFGKKYIASGGVSKRTKVDQHTVSVQAQQTVSHPFHAVDPTLPGKRWSIDGTVEVQILNPTKLLRDMRKAELLVTK